MIYIVHGEDLAKSRALIQNQQKKIGAESRIEVEVSDISPEQLFEKSHSNDLFGNPPFIVIDVSSSNRMDLNPYIEKLEQVPDTTTIIILSNKTLPKTNALLKNSARIKAKLNLNETVPQSNIFKLVDAVYNRQRDKAYMELVKLIKDDVSQFEIFSMLLYGLRTVASAKFDSPSYRKLHDFVKRKSQFQAKLFSEEQLTIIFERLRKIDKESKLSEIDEELIVPMAIETVLNS